MNDRLIVFARNPFQPGVKTRLAHGIGQHAAQGVYARLLYSLLYRLVTDCPDDTAITLSLASHSGLKIFRTAYPELDVDHQCSGDIGVRMRTAIQKAFDEGAKRVVLIGSDLPEMDWALLHQAFSKINPDTIALGPTLDGGFYLVGMQAQVRDIFHDISWSTNRVLAGTITNIEAIGCRPALLPELPDIDLPEDWQRWRDQLTGRTAQKN